MLTTRDGQVRCRPLNSRELARGAKGLVRMEGNNTYLDPPEVSVSSVCEREGADAWVGGECELWSRDGEGDQVVCV